MLQKITLPLSEEGVLSSVAHTATKPCGEAKTHEISITHKSFMEIPPISVSIRLLTYFFNIP